MRLTISKTRLLVILILVVIGATPNVFAQYKRGGEDIPPARRQHEEVYHESALRRFEIVTLIALPFTAIHSFLVVRGVEMIRQNEFSPELSGTDFKIIGASAISLALLIGLGDWLRTRDKNPSQQLIPSSPQRIPNSPQPPPRKVGQHDWRIDDSERLVVPLVHVRF